MGPSSLDVAFFISYSLLVILNCLDAYITTVGLSHGFKEVNPVMRWVQSKIGIMGSNLVKAFGSVGIGMSGLFFGLTGEHYGMISNFTICAPLIVVVLRNIVLLKRAKVSILHG